MAVNMVDHLDTAQEVGILPESQEDTDLGRPGDIPVPHHQDTAEKVGDKVLEPAE